MLSARDRVEQNRLIDEIVHDMQADAKRYRQEYADAVARLRPGSPSRVRRDRWRRLREATEWVEPLQ